MEHTFLIPTTHKIDFSKVKTIEDVVMILEGLDIRVNFNVDNCPEQFKKLRDSGLLVKQDSENK